MNRPLPILKENFFVAGGTLRRDAPCYIPRQADEQLYSSLLRSEICYVLTSRQMGKSSLMVRCAARLREAGVTVVVLDLTGLGQNLTSEQWYNGHLERIGQQLELEDELEDFWLAHKHVGPLQRWMAAVRDVVLPACPQQLVIFVDEIDAVRSLPFSADEFFAGIREFYNRRTEDPGLSRLTFCLLGVAAPSDLISDTRTTPFNIGRRIELTDFTEIEAAPLLPGLSAHSDMADRLLRRVLYWTGGHPYLTQRLCLSLSEEGGIAPGDVDRVCAGLFFSQGARQRDDNLLFVRERLLRSDVDVPTLLILYGKIWLGKRIVEEEANPLMTVLRLSGVTRVQSGLLKVRNRIYGRVFDEEWVKGMLPGAELRRQRAAFLRGLKLATAIAIPVLIAAFLYGFFAVYRVRTSVPPLEFNPPEPPVFWASFTRPGSPNADSGALLVKAGEPGAVVFINNREYGQTSGDGSLRIPVLQQGNYAIRVEKPGFQNLLQQAVVQSNKETQLTFKLQKQVVLGTMLVVEQGTPGARVLLDGSDVGQVQNDGSFTTEVRPGTHNVELAKPGYLSKQLQQDFPLGKKSVLEGQLRLDVEAQDWAALAGARDAALFDAFLRKYPTGRFSDQARRREEQLDWASVSAGKDLVALDAFLKKYPQGQFGQPARDLVAQLQREASDWSSVRNTGDPAVLDAFIRKYPHGQYVQEARLQLRKLTEQSAASTASDRQEVLGALQRLAQAFQRKDIDELATTWPGLHKQELKKVKDSFKEAEDINVSYQPLDDPQIDGDRAAVTCFRSLRYSFKGGIQKSEQGQVRVELQKRNGVWVIDSVR